MYQNFRKILRVVYCKQQFYPTFSPPTVIYTDLYEPVLTFSVFCRRIAGREREIQVHQRGAGHNLCRAGWLLNSTTKNKTHNNCRFNQDHNNKNNNNSSSKQPRTFDRLAFDLIYSKQLKFLFLRTIFLCSGSPCYYCSAR